MALTPRPDRPVDPVTVTVIRAVKDVADGLGLDAFLVGATARIILLEHVHGMPPDRATRDLDFAIAVEGWAQFHKLKTSLTSKANFENDAHAVQRLRFRPNGMESRFVVDLIPFGGIEDPRYTIAWPPEMAVLMNVAGYRDAYASAVAVQVAPDTVIPIASIPGITVLKLFAWADRGREDPKDALDLLTLLRRYTDAGNQDRVYHEAMGALEGAGYDVELAGAWLLGRDVHAISSPETRGLLQNLIVQPARMEALATDMARDLRGREDAMEFARAILVQFLAGHSGMAE